MVNIFVKIDGIVGTGTGMHQGWLKAENVALSQVHRDEFSMTRFVDNASPKFFQLYSRITTIPKVIVNVQKSGKVVWRIELANVVVSGIRTAAGHPPAEEISLNFASAKIVTGLGLAAASASTGGVAGAASRL